MSRPSHEAIAQRAYEKWEREGRPSSRAEAHWREAEHELSRPPEDPDAGAAELGAAAGEAAITNLERALSPEERREARRQRHVEPEVPARDVPHFVVTLDRAHLRIYRAGDTLGPSRMQLQLEYGWDLPMGRAEYTAGETDQAGRFPGGVRGTPQDIATHSGGSIDERLPMQEEQERRIIAVLGAGIENFLRQHPSGIWDYVAPPAVHRAVLERISRDVRERLGVTLEKDLVNAPVLDLCAHVADAREAASQAR